MKKFLVILILVVSFFIAKLFYQAGQFKTLGPHFSGKVTNIYRNMPGPEDLQMDHLTGNLFISASNRRPGTSTNDGIYLLNIKGDQDPKLLYNDFTGEFWFFIFWTKFNSIFTAS